MAILCLALAFGVLVVCLYHTYRLWQTGRTTQFREQAEDRLRYIRSLIDLVYVYQNSPDQLLRHLYTEMSVSKMLSYHIIEDRCDEVFHDGMKIKKKDQLLYLLYEAGFSPRELCVMMELNNLNSIYVKCHRVSKKLSSQATESPTAAEMLEALKTLKGPEVQEILEALKTMDVREEIPVEAE